MAYYEYQCKKCGKTFTVKQSFQEYDKHKRVRCPECGSTAVEQLFSSIHVQTSKKS